MLTEIAISNIRNLQSQQIYPGSRINLITGENAAGKSSVLEAIQLLSLGRSFRTTHLDQVISQTQHECWVRGRMSPGIPEKSSLLGFKRTAKKNSFRIDGQEAKSVAQVARLFPVQIIHPDSHLLVTGGPSARRSFIDWGCFYMDDGFHPSWSHYRRTLAQYNAALKMQLEHSTLHSLETELSIHGEKIHQLRVNYLNHLIKALPVADDLWPETEFRRIDYDSGWSADLEFAEALGQARNRSLKAGMAIVGPHRADLKLNFRHQPISEVFSRGQIKRVTVALMLAQISLFESSSGSTCTLLIDDITSELDPHSINLVSSVINQREAQCFITAISASELSSFNREDLRMFHVKHGCVNELV